jgi:hypothetical protein
MMKLTVPKNAVRKSNVFYVSSEAEPTKTYMVVRALTGAFFCQCSDFFGRRLPNMKQIGPFTYMSYCKHINFVIDVESNTPAGTRVTSAVRG